MVFLVIILHIVTSVTAIASVYATILSLNMMQVNNQLLEDLGNDLDLTLPTRATEEMVRF